MTPFQIKFLDFPESDFVWSAVQKRIEKLMRFFNRIQRCEVTLSCPHRHRQGDRIYNVHIHLSIPGDDVVVSHGSEQDEGHQNIYVAIRDAFVTAERILSQKAERLRGTENIRRQRKLREIS